MIALSENLSSFDGWGPHAHVPAYRARGGAHDRHGRRRCRPPSRLPAPSRAAAALPTAAVALGDSFISGEGAGAYPPVVDANGVAQGFPGWSAPNNNAFFCHRSANASLLPGQPAGHPGPVQPGLLRRPARTTSPPPPVARAKGRTVAAQLDQLRAVAQTHDIDLVLIGLGSNNSSFTFGDVAEKCANRFIADAWTGWWEFWAYLGGPVEQKPCTDADLATAAQFSAATAETTAAVRQLLDHPRPGRRRRPAPGGVPGLHQPAAVRPRTRSSTEPRTAGTTPGTSSATSGAERYAAGCPIHRASLAPGHRFSQGLGTIVKTTRGHPGRRVPRPTTWSTSTCSSAFDGARLCEHDRQPDRRAGHPDPAAGRRRAAPSSPASSGKDKIAIQRIANTCVSYFQTCQESWHPNAAGHQVLGQCLSRGGHHQRPRGGLRPGHQRHDQRLLRRRPGPADRRAPAPGPPV